jgi:calcineurin-like phosphoesterase family protein
MESLNMNPPTRFSRRAALGAGAGAILSAGLWPGALRAADADAGEFRFFCVNDVHCQDEACACWLESRVIKQMKDTKEKLDFVVILGDLAENGTAAEIAMARDAFKTLGLPLYVVPGNHDYRPADQSRAAYDDLFPHSLNYTFEHAGWQFVALDSTDGTHYEAIDVHDETLHWLDDTVLKLDRKRPAVVLTHFPLGDNVPWRPKNADAVLARFADLNLRAVFNGHYHGDTSRSFHDAEVTTRRCCALKRANHDRSPEKGYCVCHVKDGRITREFVEVPTAAE